MITVIVVIRLWFTRPLRDLAVLTQRQDAVSLLCSPAHSDTAASLCDCLKQVKNIPVSRLAVRVQQRVATTLILSTSLVVS